MPRKLTQDQAEKVFESKGFKLLDEYKNCDAKCKCQCSCGDITFMSMSSVKRGYECEKCAKRKISEKVSKAMKGRIYSQDFIAKKLKEADCELLSEYKGVYEPFDFKCRCGRIGKIRWHHFRGGDRCGHCGKGGRNRKYTLEEAKEVFASVELELLENEYINSQTKMKTKCKCGRIYYPTLSVIKQGKTNCLECGYDKWRGENHPRWVNDREELAQREHFTDLCQWMVRRTLEKTNQDKIDKTFNLLGYTGEILREHIKNHANYNNLIKNKIDWDVDHIFPIKAFLDYGIQNIKLINTLDNLQPLSHVENGFKSDKYDKQEFFKWLETKGIDTKVFKLENR